MAKRGAAEWRELVREWRASGQTRRVFAATRGVHPQTLSWWAWRLGSGTKSRVRPPADFVEVVVVDAPAPSAAVFVLEVGGVRVHVPGGFDGGELRRLVAALC